MNMSLRNTIGWVGGLLCLFVGTACEQSEDPVDEIIEETYELPVSFIFKESGGELTTRVVDDDGGETPEVPPEDLPLRGLYVDHIQLNVYRRLKDAVYANEREGFEYDKSVVLKCVIPEDEDEYRYATGVIDVQTRYEYRVTAIGYAENDQKKERDLFSVSESGSFLGAKLNLIDDGQYKTPELFFGTPLYGGDGVDEPAGDTVFVYKEQNQAMLEGWLYRCVAGVELTLRDVPAEVAQIELLAHSLHTESMARFYSDFLTPSGLRVAEDRSKNYVIASWDREDETPDVNEKVEAHLVDANLLPVCTALSIKITNKDGNSSITVLKWKDEGTTPEEQSSDMLRMAPPEKGNGTGIIPNEQGEEPDEPEDPYELYKICFLRNHYYQIEGSYDQLVTKDLPFLVTVNPNWDRDIRLPLGEQTTN